jgi:hypothetical protein
MAIKLYLIGDSNVDRHFAKVKSARNDPCFESVTVVKATNLAQVKGAVSPAELAEARSHVLLACLTNPIASFPFTDVSSLLKHCDSVFTQVKSYIAEGRAAIPGDLEQVLHKSILMPNIILLYHLLAVFHQKIFVLRSTLCHRCIENAPFGIRGILRKSPLLSPPLSVSQSVTPLHWRVTQTLLSSEMGFTLLRMMG